MLGVKFTSVFQDVVNYKHFRFAKHAYRQNKKTGLWQFVPELATEELVHETCTPELPLWYQELVLGWGPYKECFAI